MAARQHYRWDWQATQAVPLASSQLLPGDTLVTTCAYDTSDRTNGTKWVAACMWSGGVQQQQQQQPPTPALHTTHTHVYTVCGWPVGAAL